MKFSTSKAAFMFIPLLVLLLATTSMAAITCNVVITDLQPCVTYLQGSGSGKPPADCCNGVRALASAAATTADRQAACNCIKTASKNVNINLALAKALPGNCGINLGYTIDPSVDCSTIK
ncbi:non-specific lipid-transfer protein 1-like [Diospyros lotus]|uniref:non-specific lipid-transfer protein 1-like n=1 Tax=Diospyros lotus TaxID=55363 RepID=UPI00224E5DFE|nr:non-specific lipid-transfer protein 1-like [Diospyros lotus]